MAQKKSNGNGISSAEDFERIANQKLDGERKELAKTAEILTLPSGLKVRAYRPGPIWWLRHRGTIPQTLLARMLGGEPEKESMSGEQLLAFATFTNDLLEEMVLEPKIRLKPKKGEVSPYVVSDNDLQMLMRYGVGETFADGQSLAAFPESK